MPSPQDIKNLQERLAIHRATLSTLLSQQAILGSANAPPAVAYGIRDARAEIRRITDALRGWGVSVEDGPDDAALPVPPPEPPRPVPAHSYQGRMDTAKGLATLITYLERIGASDDLKDVLTLEARLIKLRRDDRLFGNTPQRNSEFAEIMYGLNAIALEQCGISFNELCAGATLD